MTHKSMIVPEKDKVTGVSLTLYDTGALRTARHWIIPVLCGPLPLSH